MPSAATSSCRNGNSKFALAIRGIKVEATDFNEGTAAATLEINARINRDEGKYDITAHVRNAMDVELLIPVLVYIKDPAVTRDTVDSAYALLNGKKVGLRFVGDQLQLDRPIIGLGRVTPPDAIPNIVNVTGNPDRFFIRYKEHEAEFAWSYTSE